MKRNNFKINELQKSEYTPAEVKVLDFAGSSVICQSGGINNMDIDLEDGGSSFTPNSLLLI